MDNAFHPGQLVMVDIPGTSLDADTAEFLRANKIRAVCLFRKNLGSEDEIRQLTRDLRAAMGERALIGIDQEGGSVIRALSVPQAPAAMALGAIDDEATAEAVGAAVARGLRFLGINWNFAPVLDINNNPANPVIGERSFGEDAERVTRLAHAWMRGSLREGVACCVKHFPGHGDTHVDSHHALPTVDKTLEALEALELKPFRALAQVAPAMMTAHIVYPQIDPEHPATLSKPILGELLRKSIGYQGVVITDALMMKAVFDRFGYARASVLALQAGADMPLAQGSKEEQKVVLEAIANGLADGSLSQEALLTARVRLDTLAEAYPLTQTAYAAEQRAADDALMHATWARALCALGGAKAPAPGRALRVITQASVISDGVSEAGLPVERVQALFASFADVELLQLPSLTQMQPGDVPRDGRLNVLVSNQRKRYAKAAGGAAIDLHLAIWNPFQVLDLPVPAVITWGYADGAMAALKAWLEGRAEANAQAPVTLN
ncbi:beta-N-acetylhexosaminidase [Paucibacter sp. R3-3]|uniref:Beta-N-acetylhexosaminidase n=1 Tax=Roseateles agri TaxID=3098619 RepID=A0ABU5DFU8_9BURK|nr:beta-N-acetylhexosaminidase [Paucibacter sp. R3-3]MDY0745157.1 beta-N-acetylhexosaminidase [Paucibacter sp. R3-3]